MIAAMQSATECNNWVGWQNKPTEIAMAM